MGAVGIIANPQSGKDARRLVADATHDRDVAFALAVLVLDQDGRRSVRRQRLIRPQDRDWRSHVLLIMGAGRDERFDERVEEGYLRPRSTSLDIFSP